MMVCHNCWCRKTQRTWKEEVRDLRAWCGNRLHAFSKFLTCVCGTCLLKPLHVPYLWTILCTQSVCHIFGNEQFSFSFGQPAFITCYESMLHVSFTCNTLRTSNRHITVFLQVYSIEKRKKIGMKRPWEQNNWIPFYHYTFCRVKSVPSFILTVSAPGT